MSLRSYKFPPVLDTSTSDIIEDFFCPALRVSTHYDRGVGFFSAAWLRIAARGMVDFASHSGHARWITSPILDKRDWEALQIGERARHDRELRRIIDLNITTLEESLESKTLSALAWLIADNILDFKLALPRNRLDGEFHDKFGIFSDSQTNKISFNGSYNDSIQGTRNYESIKIFKSWDEAFAPLVKADQRRFERLWNNFDPNVQVFELPDAALERIVRLRTHDRPYVLSDSAQMDERSDSETTLTVHRSLHPHVPAAVVLREYQVVAIEAWFDNNCRGLLEMATGTGKTITAFAASARLFDKEKRLAVIICVPYQHLVDQWHQDAKRFGYQPVLAYQSKEKWLDAWNQQIIEFNGGYRQFISVITTHTTFATADFQKSLARLRGQSLLIADEAHHLGAERSRVNYPRNIAFRLALSATPDRWFDDVGTTALREYFDKTVFSFPIEKAIGLSLTTYYYHPHLVFLTDEELEIYQNLTVKISRLFARGDHKSEEVLKRLLIQRANLLNTASGKLDTLSRLVDENGPIDHTLFYCVPGQIEDVIRLLGWEKRFRVHSFTARESAKQRRQLLADFDSGVLQSLVAMKCLDEGVDVPSTRVAYILASSSNPREFIQRRGRVLRKSPGKDFSVIHDLIAVPPVAWVDANDNSAFRAERSIVRRELQRLKEFANCALNKHQAIDVFWEFAKHYGLMDF